MEGDANPLCHGISQRARILHTLRNVQDLDSSNLAVSVIAADDPGLPSYTFINQSTTQLNGEYVDFLVVLHFDDFFQYSAILLAR